MSCETTIRMLEAGATAADADVWRRKAARIAWVRETAAAWREAQRQMDARCDAAVDRLSEENFDQLFEAEQAKVKAIMAPLRAVVDEDRWPRELYWGV